MQLVDNTIQRLRITTLCFIAFFLLGGYAISRPAVDSIFLEHYPSSQLPLAWFLTAVTAAITMAIYNHYNTRYSLFKLFGITAFLSGIALAALILGYQHHVPGTAMLLYLWKEIHMVLLVEIFWSFSDVVFSIKTAKSSYGFLLASGSLGGIIGNLSIGYFAGLVGTSNTLWGVLPCFLICVIISGIFYQLIHDELSLHHQENVKRHWGNSFRVVKHSRYLVYLLCIVCLMQVVVGLISYEFNYALQQAYPTTDVRTGMIGQVHAVIDTCSISLQIAMYFLLKFIGLPLTFAGIPLILCTAISAFLIAPGFLTAVSSQISAKTLDYSLFRATKEMLYIPLNREEKTQGKALIDILIYRIAKGLSSLCVLLLITIGLAGFIMHLAFSLCLLWAFLATIVVQRYIEITKNTDNNLVH